eukprot:5548430-Amphidinium_carterae.1
MRPLDDNIKMTVFNRLRGAVRDHSLLHTELDKPGEVQRRKKYNNYYGKGGKTDNKATATGRESTHQSHGPVSEEKGNTTPWAIWDNTCRRPGLGSYRQWHTVVVWCCSSAFLGCAYSVQA